MSACAHKQFEARVNVVRLSDAGRGRFTTEINIRCAACKEPFRWLGAKPGLSPYKPMVSIDGLELRAPIEPQGTPRLASHAQFVIPPLPPKSDS